MKTAVVIALVAVMLFLVGAALAGSGGGGDVCALSCRRDSDCVPAPVCHPRECLNRRLVRGCDRPEACTLIFDPQAAYENDDCACQMGTCVNLNLGNVE
ncbi:hypothetical protein QOT17_004636 [Balamuthia mandrillaris]